MKGSLIIVGFFVLGALCGVYPVSKHFKTDT